MAEETSLEAKVAELAKHVQDQARFTRAITVVCTAAILGVMFWSLVQVFSLLPQLTVLNYMSALPKIYDQWQFIGAASTKLHKPISNQAGQ